VTPADCADAVGSGGVRVLSTPHLIALMERAAMAAAAPCLAPGETTVGTRVEVEHREACPPGVAVVAQAVLREVEGRRLRFDVAVTAQGRLLGEGRHERVVLDRERFLGRLREKWPAE
jgi:predicted thioesterase